MGPATPLVPKSDLIGVAGHAGLLYPEATVELLRGRVDVLARLPTLYTGPY